MVLQEIFKLSRTVLANKQNSVANWWCKSAASKGDETECSQAMITEINLIKASSLHVCTNDNSTQWNMFPPPFKTKETTPKSAFYYLDNWVNMSFQNKNTHFSISITILQLPKYCVSFLPQKFFFKCKLLRRRESGRNKS